MTSVPSLTSVFAYNQGKPQHWQRAYFCPPATATDAWSSCENGAHGMMVTPYLGGILATSQE